jgi:hypothetical protein
MGPLLGTLLVGWAVTWTGCASAPEPADSEERADDRRPPVERLTDLPEPETHTEWTGGGEVELGGVEVELPADPALIVKGRPSAIERMANDVAATALQVAGWEVSEDSPIVDLERSGVLRALPSLAVPMLYSGGNFDRQLPGHRPSFATLAGTELPSLDPSGEVLMAIGFGRQREALRKLRLRTARRFRNYPQFHAVRFALPATDADALAEEFEGICAAERERYRRMRRSDWEDRETPEERRAAKTEVWIQDVCGVAHRIEARDGYVIADLYYAQNVGPSSKIPEPVRIEARRTEPLRPTPALRAVMADDTSFGAYTTSRMLLRLGAGNGVPPVSTVLEPAELEFEDVGLVVRRGGADAFGAGLVQTYTDQGKRVAEAGRVDAEVPGLTISNPVVEASRRWDPRSAGEATPPPRWMSPSSFQSLEELDGFDWIRLRGRDRHHQLLRVFLTAPVATVHHLWKRADQDRRKRTPLALYGLQPSAGRAGFTLNREESESSSPELVGGATFLMAPNFREHLPRTFRRMWRRLSKWFDDEGVEFAVRALPGPQQKRIDVWQGVRRESVFGEPEPVDGPSVALRADLEGQAEAISGARHLFERYERLELASRIGERAQYTQLHLGSATSERLAGASGDIELMSPSPPPQCYTDVIRFAEDLSERVGRPWDTVANSREAAASKHLDGLSRLEEMAETCEGLSPGERADLAAVLRAPSSQIAGFFAEQYDFERAGRLLGRSCSYGAERACRVGPFFDDLHLPEVDHVEAAAGDAPDQRHSKLHRLLGPGGVTRGSEYLFGWRAHARTAVPPESGDREPSRMLRDVRRCSDCDDPPRAAWRFFTPVGTVGGIRLSPKRSALLMTVDRSLPAVHLEKLLRQWSAIASGISDDPTASGDGCRRGECGGSGSRAPFAMLVDRRESPERGYLLLHGAEADAADATVRVSVDGIELSVEGSALDPVSGCPSEGPTVCLSSGGTAAEALAAHRKAFSGASEGEDGPVRSRTSELVELYTGPSLQEGLRRTVRRADGGSLQIVVDSRVPFGVVARILSTALFETSEDGEGGPAEVRDRGFEYLYMKLSG